ncbi:MAG: DNA internalization-related competence protein ComEC/Rec2, partial [Enterovibrio sp.]
MTFLVGMLLAYISLRWWCVLLDIRLAAIVLISIGFLRIYPSKYSKTRVVALNFLLGLSLAAFIAAVAQTVFVQKIEQVQEVNKETILTGEVNSLFIANTAYPTVLFKITAINQQNLSWNEQIVAQLHWQSDKPLKQGQRWKITARLREPYGRANEAGFAAESFFLAHGIHGKGTVLSATLLDDKIALRQRLFDAVAPKVLALPNGRFLLALAFGEQDLLTQEDWQYLRSSGLAHLLAISGLHIGFSYLLGFWLGRAIAPLASRSDKLVWLPFVTGLLLAFIYTWLAGFLIPSQRTLLALAVFTLLRLSCVAIGPFALLTLVACIVLSFDPFAVFSASFWLSFGAVLLLCCMGALIKVPHPPDKMGKLTQGVRMLVVIQAFLTVGMLPLMKVWFAGTSASGFLFNLFAVPLVSFICVPLILLALLGSLVGADFMWAIADVSITPLMWLLPLSHSQWFSLAHFELLWLLLLPLVIITCCVLRARRLRFSFVLFAILLFWQAPAKESDAWQIDVLDVGHGLAVLITQDNESVLYDTGASWENGSIAQQVITPILETRGAKLVGML